ncbi:MAG: 30S ribosomal protein S11 [Patescibacteria group bacterium]|jgi:Ribosomal protein S11|nr:30S ribosomal protein S11 [Patescibacteria group bacterium]
MAEIKSKNSTTKKRKITKNVPIGQVHLFASFNNTLITFTDDKGNVLLSNSAGACGFKGSKKGTAYAAQVASEKVIQEAKNKYGLIKADVYIKGIGLGRDSAVRIMSSMGVDVSSIYDVTGVKHGGVRPRKVRKN